MSSPYVMLVIELAEGGELSNCFLYSGHFDDKVARTYFRQLISALEACHILNIFHRDIKPANILLDGHFRLKLADWGLSSQSTTPSGLLQSQCGTIEVGVNKYKLVAVLVCV